MALLFSAVTLTGDDDQVELLVPGIPKELSLLIRFCLCNIS